MSIKMEFNYDNLSFARGYSEDNPFGPIFDLIKKYSTNPDVVSVDYMPKKRSLTIRFSSDQKAADEYNSIVKSPIIKSASLEKVSR